MCTYLRKQASPTRGLLFCTSANHHKVCTWDMWLRGWGMLQFYHVRMWIPCFSFLFAKSFGIGSAYELNFEMSIVIHWSYNASSSQKLGFGVHCQNLALLSAWRIHKLLSNWETKLSRPESSKPNPNNHMMLWERKSLCLLCEIVYWIMAIGWSPPHGQ